jgi:hypothetical protein
MPAPVIEFDGTVADFAAWCAKNAAILRECAHPEQALAWDSIQRAVSSYQDVCQRLAPKEAA